MHLSPVKVLHLLLDITNKTHSTDIVNLSPKFLQNCSPFSFSLFSPPSSSKELGGKAEESFLVKSKVTLESSLIGCWKCSIETCFCQWKTLFVTIRIACSMLFDPGRTLIYASTSNIAKDVTMLWKENGGKRRKGNGSAGMCHQADDIESLMHWSSEIRLWT